MIPVAKENGAQMVILNAEPTPFDDLADVVLREPIGKALPSICAGVE
jgi:NAD-dependent deacetylase